MDNDKLDELTQRLTQWERDTDAASYPIDCDELRALITAARRPALPDREAVARKLAELKGHRDTDAVIWSNDEGKEHPVWAFYAKDADALLALFALSPDQPTPKEGDR